MIFWVFLFACSCSVSRHEETVGSQEATKPIKPVYFVTVPIKTFSSTQSPCLEIQVEDKMFSVALDLGYRGNLTFTKELASAIASRVFLREKPMYGVRGKEYATTLYRIPELKIGKMTFFKPILQEEGEDFSIDATFSQEDRGESGKASGRLGWELFYSVNLLIDTKNSLVAFSDSLATLGQKGYDVERFTSTTLFLERGLIEFDAETSEGILRCALDTGSTFNLFNIETFENQTLEEGLLDTENHLEYPSFKIDKTEFGPMVFRRFPIKIPIKIEAILGMEFFKTHLVFLDFSNKKAYFFKSPADND